MKSKVWENFIKGIWWMPRHKETMKDVAACDKPRLGGKQPLIRGFPNGETYPVADGMSLLRFLLRKKLRRASPLKY